MPENKTLNIIALSCSPSKHRNSDSLLDAFISGIESESNKNISKNINIKIEKIYLNDIPIDIYKYENRGGPESYETEFRELTEKIKNSNGLIIATPTYNFGVPGHLKNFIDRIRFFALNFDEKNNLGQPSGLLGYLRTYFIVTGGTPTWAEKILFFAFPSFWLRGVFLYYNSACLGAYYTGNVRAFENKKILNKCKKKGTKYARQLSRNKHNRTLERIFWRPPQVD